ncbi:MAG: RNA-splicing factor [Chrysothrix sp. TS-e1954]|nr:MAG: RNA-splicing factor [Chrysothrix sp. TS-e1954]
MADVADAVPPPGGDPPVALFKKRTIKPKSILRKRLTSPIPQQRSDSEDSRSSEDDAGHRVKRRKKGGVTGTSEASKRTNTGDHKATEYAADANATIEVTNDATRHANWYDESAKGALSSRNLLGNSKNRGQDVVTKSNALAITQTTEKESLRKVGPVKAPANVRTITITDMAPDVCKDYKQTGFCGFGDSCKFLHAREDYKQGWELDRDWEIGTKGKKVSGKTVASANRKGKDGDGSDDEDALLESIPFACIICKEPYKFPIVTKCGHYFCEACALQRYKKSPTCAACGSGTGGMFNGAKQLKRLLEKKKDRAKKRKEAAREAGEEVSGDDEEAD